MTNTLSLRCQGALADRVSEGLARDETQVYGSQFGSYDHPQQPLQALRQPVGALDSVATAPRLHKDVQHNAILIDRSPEIMLDALDWNEHLVEEPLISGPRPTTSQATGKICTELLTPGPYRPVGDLDAAQLFADREKNPAHGKTQPGSGQRPLANISLNTSTAR